MFFELFSKKSILISLNNQNLNNMVLRIFQLDTTNENALRCLFLDYDYVKDNFDFNNYKQVYEDQNFCKVNRFSTIIEENDDVLNYIFEKFNRGNYPETYNGHSLSVSDIVELDGVRYYVDGFGFVKL